MTEQSGEAGRRSGSLGSLLWLPALAAGAWIAYSRLMIDHTAFLPNAIPGADVAYFDSAGAGKVNYYADLSGSGEPLVLVHSINAAASAYEMGPLFARYRGTRPVYALDLPGYGFSERVERPYSPVLFEGVVRDFLRHVVGKAADVIALSLGSEFVARAALAEPALVRSLVLISPTGLSMRADDQASEAMGSPDLHRLFAFPLWARAFFDLLTTRPVLRAYLRKSFVGEVPDGLVDYAYATAHQPGAEIVPLRFISGLLFTPDVCRHVYEKLDVPTLMVFDEDAYSRFDKLPEVLHKNPNWRTARIRPTLGLPHWEKPRETTDALNGFWSTIPAETAVRGA